MKTLYVKQEFLDWIIKGKKTLEVRVGYPHIGQLKAGDAIRLLSQGREQIVYLRDIRHYKTFSEMLDCEHTCSIAPDMPIKEELLQRIREIYPSEKEKLGVVVLEIELPTSGQAILKKF